MKRSSGVLLHISSLAGRGGIGSFGKEAYRFVDFLVKTKQTYWQILPLTTTSYGDSPYQSFSSYAGNTNFIDLDLLIEAGYLEAADLEGVDFGQVEDQVDYGKLFDHKGEVLKEAVKNFLAAKTKPAAYEAFMAENRWWLEDYALFMALKEDFGHVSWQEWPKAYRLAEADLMAQAQEDLANEIDYHRVTQYFFYQQWMDLKAYANEHSIEIIGDIPIYVSPDSVEIWKSPELFLTNDAKEMTFVGGTPPDNFSTTGQYWGNPLYDWQYHQETDYEWWSQRISQSFKLYDVLRIDHFRGFESFWKIPYGAKTAAEGHWEKGPGIAFFRRIHEKLGDLNIIAEDLGFLTQEVMDMLEASGYPGMKILQFGFSGQHLDSFDLPHNYPFHSIAYVGNHDNETAEGWYKDSASQASIEQLYNYFKMSKSYSASQVLNRGIAASTSNLAIYTMQDLLGLDNKARMNQPSTLGGNWTWRLKQGQINDEVVAYLKELTETYYRENSKLVEE